MKFITKVTTCLFLVIAFQFIFSISIAYSEDVYIWKDENGVTHMSNVPAPSSNDKDKDKDGELKVYHSDESKNYNTRERRKVNRNIERNTAEIQNRGNLPPRFDTWEEYRRSRGGVPPGYRSFAEYHKGRGRGLPSEYESWEEYYGRHSHELDSLWQAIEQGHIRGGMPPGIDSWEEYHKSMGRGLPSRYESWEEWYAYHPGELRSIWLKKERTRGQTEGRENNKKGRQKKGGKLINGMSGEVVPVEGGIGSFGNLYIKTEDGYLCEKQIKPGDAITGGVTGHGRMTEFIPMEYMEPAR